MEKKVNSNIIFGKRNVKEFIKKKISEGIHPGEWGIYEVITRKNPSREIQTEILQYIKSPIRTTVLSQGDLDTKYAGMNHQGILLRRKQSSEFSYLSLETLIENMSASRKPLLILDRIQDTGNLGNLIRTAECFGILDIIVPERDMAPINEVVERISSGALHHVRIYRVLNLHRTIELLKELGYWILSTGENGDSDWSGLPSPDEIAVILGNEEKGVKKIVYESSDFRLQIPLRGSVSSLNVTVACGVVLDRIINRQIND